MLNSARFPTLLHSPLLEGLADPFARGLLDQAAMQLKSRGTVLLRQGEASPGLYLVASGTVEVSFTNSAGQTSIIHHAGPGETLGEAEAVSEKLCVASCVAQVDVIVLLLRTPQLYALLREPDFLRNFVGAFCVRMERENLFKLVDQQQPVEQRICNYLAKLAAGGPVITRSQTYLADMVGCSRQTVNRTLGALREAGVIELRKGAISVLDLEALRRRGSRTD